MAPPLDPATGMQLSRKPEIDNKMFERVTARATETTSGELPDVLVADEFALFTDARIIERMKNPEPITPEVYDGDTDISTRVPRHEIVVDGLHVDTIVAMPDDSILSRVHMFIATVGSDIVEFKNTDTSVRTFQFVSSDFDDRRPAMSVPRGMNDFSARYTRGFNHFMNSCRKVGDTHDDIRSRTVQNAAMHLPDSVSQKVSFNTENESEALERNRFEILAEFWGVAYVLVGDGARQTYIMKAENPLAAREEHYITEIFDSEVDARSYQKGLGSGKIFTDVEKVQDK
jgi:hypothetical protein